jgi:glycosyltransferase involved in cell wall biosynthesis
MTHVDVSVVLTTYNRLELLKQAIASCFEGSEPLALEVIVVDDGSTDGTREWLAALNDDRIQVVLQQHKGAQHARNRGKEAAKGTYVKFLDDDDLLVPGALLKQFDVLETSGLDVAYGHIHVRHENDDDRLTTLTVGTYDLLYEGVMQDHLRRWVSNCLIRREVVKDMNWETWVPFHQDVQFMCALSVGGTTSVSIGEPSIVIRQHDGDRVSSKRNDISSIERVKIEYEIYKHTLESVTDETYQSFLVDHIWNIAHMISSHDVKLFDEMYSIIDRHKQGYLPDRGNGLLELMDRFASVKTTEYALVFPRKVKHILQFR